MSTYRPIDSKREEFRKYLERAGVMDALTKVLVMLYEEPDKPDDALEFMRMNLGDKRPAMAEIEAMKNELDAALLRIKELEDELAQVRSRPVELRRSQQEAAPELGPADTTSENGQAQ